MFIPHRAWDRSAGVGFARLRSCDDALLMRKESTPDLPAQYQSGPGVITRRTLLVTAAATAGSALVGSTEAAASQGNIVIDDRTARQHGPVVLLGDSTSTLTWRSMQRTMVARGLGPFRLDLQPGRLISRPGGWGRSGVEAVRSARATGMDAPAYVVALGVRDIIPRPKSTDPLGSVAQITATIEPLLEEIGRTAAIGFVNLYATTFRTDAFNTALAGLRRNWPRLYLLDWASPARAHRTKWLQRDGYHPNYFGSVARTQFLARSMVDMALFAEVLARQ